MNNFASKRRTTAAFPLNPVAAGCAVFLTILANSAYAQSATYKFDLPAQPLSDALRAVGRTVNKNILFDPALVEGLNAPVLRASLTLDAAMKALLAGTRLEFEAVDANTVLLKSASSPAAPRETSAVPDPSPVVELEEVLVTAQKRSERLEDVPVPVTVIGTEALTEQNLLRIEDYYASVPGLSFSSNGHGDASLSIRGVTTGGYTNPTVGVTIDDVPLGTSTALGNRTAAPDFDPSDLARIEVLRGPQGTLYGASSIGGLLKYVTVDPSTDAVSGRVQADLTSVNHGDGAGYGVHGAVNIPVSDTVAIRASGFSRREPGYIDDPVRDIKGVNQEDVYGAHLSALWRPNSDLSLKIGALYQNNKADGTSYSTLDPTLGPLQQAVLGGTGGYQHQLQAYAATLSASFLGMKLVSATGYSIDQYDSTVDLTSFYGGVGGPTDTIFAVTASDQLQRNRTRKFSQELRLSGATRWLDWLVGGFYTHEDTPSYDVYRAIDANTLAVAGRLWLDTYPTTYSEYAAFGDLTFHILEQLDLQVGARESQNRQSYTETYSGPLNTLVGLPDPAINPPVHTKDSSFTYLVTPEYKFSPHLMSYARLASGYRPGGPNPTCTLYPTPCEYQPDRTHNYELGVKGDLPGYHISFDASVYYIDWKDIQVQVFNDAGVYYTNASSARSQGLELALRARPVERLTISAWIALNDAKLTSDLPLASTAVGVSGDRLPFSSRFSGNLSVDKQWLLTDRWSGFAGASLNYVGNRKDNFPSSPQLPRYGLPAYAQANLRLGVNYDAWTVSAFVNNVADRRGQLSYPQVGPGIFGLLYIQPRTAGLSLSRTF